MKAILGSSSSGNQAQRHRFGEGHTKLAIAPTVPHKYGGAKLKPRGSWDRDDSMIRPMKLSQLPMMNSSDSLPSIQKTVQSKVSQYRLAE